MSDTIVGPIYHAFTPREVGTSVLGVERLADVADEIHSVYEAHYRETEAFADDPFNPDYARCQKMEADGQFVLFTVRIFGTIVGYIQYFVFRDMHCQSVYQAKEDAFFLLKEHRGRGLAPALLSYAEYCLPQLGCKYVSMSSKAPMGGSDIDGFLKSQGYEPVAISYAKRLEESEHGIMQQPASAS